MKGALRVGLLFFGIGTAGMASVVAFGGHAHAQSGEVWEYGYLVNVVSVESWEIGIRSWSGSQEDKAYLRAHVFPYERGLSDNDLTLNRLRRMNELAEEGWEVCYEPSGLLRRRR
jgi:hypothetical protein